jgi:hypothetical protein
MRQLATRKLALIPLVLILAIFLSACSMEGEPGENNRKDAVTTREKTFDRAEHAYPIYVPQNFPIRQALIEFTERQDMINHPWYIYLMGMDGTYIGYYVGKTYPVNACNFLSSTEIVDSSKNGKVVLTAPSLDGIFYGGGGSSAACESLFFFDVNTNAMITFSVPTWFASDVPLQVEAKRLNPKTQSSEAPTTSP